MNARSTATQPSSVIHALQHPSAFAPILMSLVALSLVILHIALYGSAREADEGTVAHLWQLLMGLQIPIIAFFAIRWLPVAPRPAMPVLALQFVAGVAAAAPVCYFHL